MKIQNQNNFSQNHLLFVFAAIRDIQYKSKPSTVFVLITET